MKKWKKIKTLETYDCGGHYRIDKDRVLTPGGKETDYFVQRMEPTASVIPIDKSGKIHMTSQHRYPTDTFTLELPAGKAGGNNKKELFESAKRELEEETGLTSKEWQMIGSFDEVGGINDLVCYVFIARNVVYVENPTKDPLDKNLHENVVYSYRQIEKMIASGKVRDGLTISSFMIAEKQGLLK